MNAARIIGWGLRTPLGVRAKDVAARVLGGDRAVGRAQGDVTASRHARFLARLPLLALDAAHEAAHEAGLAGCDRVGVFAGVGGLRVDWDELATALAEQHADGSDAWARGLHRIHPFWMLRNLSNNSHALLAADLGARGDGMTLGGATAGAQAIAAASRALAAGSIDAAIVVAYDTLLVPELAALVDGPAEAAAAIVLAGSGTARASVAAASTADGESGEPRIETVARVASRVCERSRASYVLEPGQLGALGAATALVQAIVAAELLREQAVPGATALCLSTGAPGLAAAVVVEVAR